MLVNEPSRCDDGDNGEEPRNDPSNLKWSLSFPRMSSVANNLHSELAEAKKIKAHALNVL